MNDLAQTNLKEPVQVDWDALGKSGYTPPPPALGPDGKSITYYGVVETATPTDSDEDYLNFLLDPIKIVRSGQGADGVTLRFTRASTKPFMKNGQALRGNPNKLANFLRAVGVQARPQTNADYTAAVKAAVGKPFGFTLDWEAYNKDTGEKVKGFSNFPDDPERPGLKKSILKAGDVVTERDAAGNVTGTREIKSEVLFANPRLRYFQDAPKARG